jgi:hypothetical protein
MSEVILSAPAPGSIEAQAIAELEKEGHVINGDKPAVDERGELRDTPVAPKEEPRVEEKPKVETPKEESKTQRTPTMVEAWKLKVAEDQKDAAIAAKAELEAKLEEMSKQKTPITQTQERDLADEIKELAKDNPDLDTESLTKMANVLMKRMESKSKVSPELENTVKKLQEERELQVQLNEYSNEFEKDVLPLVADYQLSGEALSQLKETLKGYAFSETYARVPLKEIFAIKNSELSLSVPKKSSEGKAPKSRTNDTIDIDSLSEEDFAKLPVDKIEEFMQKKSSNSWKRK